MRPRKIVIPLVAALLLAAAYAAWERLTFDREAWLADYEQLRSHTSRNYANLLWVIDERGLDPVALHQATLRKLEDARTARAARAALASFVSAFQDAHFRIARTRLSDRLERLFTSEATEIAADTDAAKACAALGFADETEDLGFEGPGIQTVDAADNSFAAALVPAGAARAGLVRIPIFDTKRYRPACERAWRERIGARSCDGTCIDTFIQVMVPNQLLAELAARVSALESAGATLLVIDVTGNGGGTDWVEPAARLVASKPLACAPVSFIRGPHWMNAFSTIKARIEEDLAVPQSSGDIALLQVARRRAGDLADLAGITCALDGLWTGGARPACSNLVEGSGYSSCGLMGPLPKGSLSRAASRDALFLGLGYDYVEAVFGGPLAVLIDGGTASAAEYFAAVLADNGAATLIGQRTFGVGCGYTGAGAGVLLNRSGLKVEMPDCQRLRRDGTNEMAGISPDVAVDWKPQDGAAGRWAKLAPALAALAK